MWTFTCVSCCSIQWVFGLQKWISGKRGPVIEVKSGEVRLAGRLLRTSDLVELAENGPNSGDFTNRMQMSDSLTNEVERYFEDRIE